jgi:hypothetical protein
MAGANVMALANYSDLLASISNWLHRGDLTTIAPDLVRLGESRMNRDLLIADRFTEATGTMVSPLAFPSDYWSMKSLVMVQGGYETPLRMISPEEYAIHKASGGFPYGFTEIDGAIRFASDASGTYAMRYYTTIPELSLSNQTNAILTKYPDLYLWASLAEAASFVGADDRMQLWESKYQNAVAAIKVDDDRRRFGGSILRQRAVTN